MVLKLELLKYDFATRRRGRLFVPSQEQGNSQNRREGDSIGHNPSDVVLGVHAMLMSTEKIFFSTESVRRHILVTDNK